MPPRIFHVAFLHWYPVRLWVQIAELRVALTSLEQQAVSAAQRAKREQHHLTEQLAHVKAEVAALTEDRYELQVCL